MVEAQGSTVMEIVESLNSQFKGIKFRMIDENDSIRQHIRIFVNADLIKSLDYSLNETDEIHIMTALSGG